MMDLQVVATGTNRTGVAVRVERKTTTMPPPKGAEINLIRNTDRPTGGIADRCNQERVHRVLVNGPWSKIGASRSLHNLVSFLIR